MPSFREERLQERVAEIRPTVGQGPRDRRVGRVREPGDDRRGAEDLRRDHGQGPQVADAVKQHRHDQEVFAFARELSDNVIGGLSGGDLSSSGSGPSRADFPSRAWAPRSPPRCSPDGTEGAGAHWCCRRRPGVQAETLSPWVRSRSRCWTCSRPSSTPAPSMRISPRPQERTQRLSWEYDLLNQWN